MPNIIINNVCNQSCSYCFAHENMNETSVKKQMSLGLFLKILKFLKSQNEEVRILWWEPLLHSHIRTMLQIAVRWGFDVIIFSNLNLPNKRIREVFGTLNVNRLRINVNINHPSFYSDAEWSRLQENIEYLKISGIEVILGYNIHDLTEDGEFIFTLAKRHDIRKINLKITNSTVGWPLIVDTRSRPFGDYLFDLIARHHITYEIEVSCGLDVEILDTESLKKLKLWLPNIRFGCEANAGKFDINTDGSIFRCFPLQNACRSPMHILHALSDAWSVSDIGQLLRAHYPHTDGECGANRLIKTSNLNGCSVPLD